MTPDFATVQLRGNQNTEPMQRGVVIAVILHAAFILGVDLGWDAPTPASSRLEVTLTSLVSEVPPADADFIANADHHGSGDAAQRAAMTTDRMAKTGVKTDTTSTREMVASTRLPVPDLAVVTSTAEDAARPLPERTPRPPEPEENDGLDPLTRLEREIVALEARLDRQQQAIAKAPRVRRLTSVSTRRAEDAAYLTNWRKKIEAVGNSNYPLLAARQKIEGELRLAVVLLPDGSVREVNTLKSSGKPILDRAALRIVYLAAPFEPFTPDMRKTMDRLEIIRTWRFEQSTFTATE